MAGLARYCIAMALAFVVVAVEVESERNLRAVDICAI
jgi:hypothetical protein